MNDQKLNELSDQEIENTIKTIIANIDGFMYYTQKSLQAAMFIAEHFDVFISNIDDFAAMIPKIISFIVKYPDRFVDFCNEIAPAVEQLICIVYDKRSDLISAYLDINFSRLGMNLAKSFVASIPALLPAIRNLPAITQNLGRGITAVLNLIFGSFLAIPDVLLSYAGQHMNTWFEEEQQAESQGNGGQPPHPPQQPKATDEINKETDIDLNMLMKKMDTASKTNVKSEQNVKTDQTGTGKNAMIEEMKQMLDYMGDVDIQQMKTMMETMKDINPAKMEKMMRMAKKMRF